MSRRPKRTTDSTLSPPSAEANSNPQEERDYAEIARHYIDDVLSGKLTACKWVRLACERHIHDLERSETDWPYKFDAKKAARPCRFIEALPHVKGEWARRNEKIRLEPWQCFVLTTIFGWVKKADDKRRFTEVDVCVARKNAKSTIASGIALYMLAADGEAGAEVYLGANSKEQTKEVYDPAKRMCEKSPRVCQAFGIEAHPGQITVLKSGSVLKRLIGKPGDGSSPSCAIVDEYHEADTDHLVDAMRTGMGARSQPLLLKITTAGATIGGPCYQQHKDIERVLEGVIERDDLFGVLFTRDTEDEWTSDEALEKANPNLDVSVSREFLEKQRSAAIVSTRKQNIFRTKHLDEWVGASSAWMNAQLWARQADPTLKIQDCKGLPCVAALDLSSKLDITARALVFVKPIDGSTHYYAFTRLYIPDARGKLPELENYRNWIAEGALLTTPGNVIDYDRIEDDTVAEINEYKIREVGFDPWNAEQIAQHLAKRTRTQAIEVPNQARALSEPMKQLEALVLDGRFHHDDNPCMNWMMSNVVAHVDAKDNIFPRKERDENKIDGPVALIMAMSRALLLGTPNGSVYAKRGLLTL